MHAIGTRVCTASYTCIVFTDKSTKLASVQEANVTAMINGMQRYLELLVREEEDNNPVPIKGKNQLTIMRFAVSTPQYSLVPKAQSSI